MGLTRFRRDPLRQCKAIGDDELTLTHNAKAVAVVVSPERYKRLEDPPTLDYRRIQQMWREKLRRTRPFAHDYEAVVVALLQVRSVLELLTEEWVRDTGIDDLQLDILFILVDHGGPCTEKQILRRLVCSSKRLKYALNKLKGTGKVLEIEQGYVATDEGCRVEDEFWRRFAEDCERLFDGLDMGIGSTLLHGLFAVSQRIERFTESLREGRG